jgi:hypothetical protein
MRRRFGSAALALSLVSALTRAASAQDSVAHDEHDDDHEHGHLHFSHPMVTESPSPDTKLRLDYLWGRKDFPTLRLTAHELRLEGEYAFSPAFSVAVTVPYVWVVPSGLSGVNGFDNTELSLKAASLRWAERGLLVGGGMSAGLPTGSDERGIGTSRAVELEPFVDLALKRGRLELVGFGHYGTTVRNAAGRDAEREVGLNGSLLYAVAPVVEALIEVESVRDVAPGEEHSTTSLVAPGVKLYPFRNRQLMAGVSGRIGVGGGATDFRGLLVSAFYHF